MKNGGAISLSGARLEPLGSGALWWPDEALLTVGDLHLGKAERTARLGGSLLPPYETRDTLDRLDAVIAKTRPRIVVSLGDSFDDPDAPSALTDEMRQRLQRMAAGRRWFWIAGNHDPGPADLPGTYLAEFAHGALTFRHIAQPDARGEISAHFHPKARITARGQRISRPCFLADRDRVILPAFGTYTGGLDITSPTLRELLAPDAVAYLTGSRVIALPTALSVSS